MNKPAFFALPPPAFWLKKWKFQGRNRQTSSRMSAENMVLMGSSSSIVKTEGFSQRGSGPKVSPLNPSIQQVLGGEEYYRLERRIDEDYGIVGIRFEVPHRLSRVPSLFIL